MGIAQKQWGVARDGTPVDLFTLTVASGMEASIATYGGVVVRLTAPDREGVMADVTLGYQSLDGYFDDGCFFGCLVGRVANRIANASFFLDGREHRLDQNHGSHHLHGGSRGFHSRVWQVDSVTDGVEPGLTLTHVSRDGEQGYPGNLKATVVYTLTEDGLRLDFSATTDRLTVVNMTNHSYFNLSGQPGSDCLGHVLTIPAHRYIETDRELIPTGRLAEVDGTPLDFTGGVSMGSRIDADFPALAIGQGYDHFFVLDDEGEGVKLAASVHEPVSGRGMEVWTTNPGVQFYSGNHIPEGLAGMDGAFYGKRFGFCLEAQGFVDAPNRAGFPSVVLEPGAVYRQSIMYKFFVK